MAYFPLLKNLCVRNYGLYPGPQRDGVFDVEFDEGLTLLLGANGLGKTTLMTMVFVWSLVPTTYLCLARLGAPFLNQLNSIGQRGANSPIE